MEVNEYQIGGDHYNNKEYQHWDFVCESGLHYLLGCATKYVSRWREKNGIQDLKKSAHYISKAVEEGVTAPSTYNMDGLCDVFCNQLEPMDAEIIKRICDNEFQLALNLISDLVIGYTCIDKE